MSDPVLLTEVIRGGFSESRHRGHWVACTPSGEVIEGGGDPDLVILPRSSLKPVQALPLIESGAAAAFGLTDADIALAAASHRGMPVHSAHARDWLSRIGLSEADLRCGVQPPATAADRQRLRDERRCADQTHNNCSGKHAGFLTLTRHLGADPEYIDPDHPVQRAVREAVAEMTDVDPPGHAIDGCSAPNFATTLSGLARAMARIAVAGAEASDTRSRAAARIRGAMVAHPHLVAGEGAACTRLIRAMSGTIVKTGAEGVYVAALPGRGIGIALKVEDGATRASETAITALLVRFGALDPDHPEAQALLAPEIRNRRDILAGHLQPAPDLIRA